MEGLDKKGFIYLLRNLNNGKGYVGQHVGTSAETRWNQHIGDSIKGSELAIHRAIRKYGVEGFSAEVIWEGPALDLDKVEIKFIEEFRTFGEGYNMTRGGYGLRGYSPSLATRAKIGAAQLGSKRSEATKLEMSRTQTGKKRSPEACANISRARMGHEVTLETRRKLSLKHTGKTLAESTKSAISRALSGQPQNPNTAASLAIWNERQFDVVNLRRSGWGHPWRLEGLDEETIRRVG